MEVPHNFISIAFVDLEDEIDKGNISPEDFENLLLLLHFRMTGALISTTNILKNIFVKMFQSI